MRENAYFVVDRSQLKNSEVWLVTDLQVFENCGSSARVLTIADGKIIESRYSRGSKSEKKIVQRTVLVRNVFEHHKKYNDFCCTSTVVMKLGW